ncbi:MAG: twin-arginine translocation signal domain-containing protein [Betaproteobacteria bacterium]|nr:twin-arginine translocation signal domain-containing protein [Betaproteobacteria bacterium]
MERRDFVKLCAATAATATLPTAAQAAALKARLYPRALLVEERGQPVRSESLRAGVNYVFEYPFAATPCFLLRLSKPTAGGIDLRTEAGGLYRWEGGVGPEKTLVAYSAICAHKLTYPTRQVSFIGYRDAPSPVAGPGKVITCCSDRSVYDPSAGARVVSGPAPQPLATILLEHDASKDEFTAVGTFGGEMFNMFFQKFGFRLELEMGDRAKSGVEGRAVVRELSTYSAQWAQC